MTGQLNLGPGHVGTGKGTGGFADKVSRPITGQTEPADVQIRRIGADADLGVSGPVSSRRRQGRVGRSNWKWAGDWIDGPTPYSTGLLIGEWAVEGVENPAIK